MAEFVQSRIEKTITELEGLVRIGLFTKEETRLIVNKRKRYEYKLQRRKKAKEDFLRYIQYELDLARLIVLRSQNQKISPEIKHIENNIHRRVNSLFFRVKILFKSDVKLWISHIKFCQKFNYKSSVSTILIQMLAVHSDKPKLWTFAAKWEFLQNNFESARKFMLRGLRFHPRSKLIYKAYLIMELKYPQQLMSINEQKKQLEKELRVAENTFAVDKPSEILQETSSPSLSNQSILEGKLPEIIFSSVLNTFKDAQFPVELFHIATKYNYTKPLQKKMLAELKQKYCNNELVYDLEARCSSPSVTKNLKKCKLAYSKALKEVPTERMWTLYLDVLSSITLCNQLEEIELTQNLIFCHNLGLLDAKFYPGLIHFLIKNNPDEESGLKILREAIGRFPNNVDFRKMCIEMHLKDDEEELAVREFDAAEVQLGKDNADLVPLYACIIQHFEIGNIALADKFFKRSILSGPNISTGLKPCYLQWIYEHKDISEARKEYAFMNSIPPLCSELHNKMIELETAQTKPHVENIRRCYNLACQQFGDKDVDLWMSYVQFETKTGDAKLVSAIYSRAVAQLNVQNLDRFIAAFVVNRSASKY